MDGQPGEGNPSDVDRRDLDAELDRAWRDHRRHLLDIGFRMLGNLSEAEDVVQEAFARLVRADLVQIDDVTGWLVAVTSRLCIDRLRSHQRHPTTPEPSLGDRPAQAGPGRGDAGVDPADRVTLDDDVRAALQVVLERLTPAERTAFVLHDVFRYPFEDIAEIVGRTPAACRQLASRARRAISADVGRSRFRVESAEQRHVTEQFIAACSTGDLDGLLAVLDPEVVGGADLGAAGVRVERGSATAAPLLLRFLGPDSGTTLLSLPSGEQAEVVALRQGRVVAFLSLEVRDGRIHHIDAIVDPTKLAPIGQALGA